MAARLPGAAVGRPAAARGAGARAGVRAAAGADGRAARRAGQAVARAHADRAQGTAPPARRHLRLRHARPGRGADDVATASRSSTTARSSRSTRSTACTRRRPTASSPASSATARCCDGTVRGAVRRTTRCGIVLPDGRVLTGHQRQRRGRRRVGAGLHPARAHRAARARPLPASAATCCRRRVGDVIYFGDHLRLLLRDRRRPADATVKLPLSVPMMPQPRATRVWLEFPPEHTRIYRVKPPFLPQPSNQRSLTMNEDHPAPPPVAPPCLALPALAQQITVVNFGGANANAQKKAFYEPFEKSRHQGRAGRIQRRAGQDQGHGRDQEGHLGRGRGRVARRRARLRRGPVREARLHQDRQQGRLHAGGRHRVRHRHLRVVHGDGLQRRQAQDGAHDLGRLLGHEEVPRQARHAQGRALQPRVRADGRRREAGRRLQGAGHQGRRRSRVQEARPS